MKTNHFTKTFSCAALLAFALSAPASVYADSAQATEPAHDQSTNIQFKPAGKAHKSKSKKAYSKATLSAMQPLPASSNSAPPQSFNSAASIALSPVVNKDVVQPLNEKPAAVLPDDSAKSSLAIAAQPVGQSYDEESSLNQHEMATETVATDSDVLGQESVSVVDRFADKPKAKPISEGPLRVKMKDSGVRASVQIPLTQLPQ